MSMDMRAEYPENSVVGSVDASKVDDVRADLSASGYDSNGIRIVSSGDVEGVETPFTRDGLRGFLERLLLSMGGDLRELEYMRQDLADGRSLVAVPVQGDDAKLQAREILRRHDAHRIRYFGSWTIESLD